MNWRKWAMFVALAGVLLHAAAVARHNAVTIAAVLQHDTPFAAADLSGAGVICGYTDLTGPATAPDRPAKTASSCPICTGCVSAVALPIADGGYCPAGTFTVAHPVDASEYTLPRIAWLAPSGRAPPA